MTAERCVLLDGEEIRFLFERKRVKNLNLRVRKDGSVYVSAPSTVALAEVDAFVRTHVDFIRRARAALSARPAEKPLHEGSTVFYLGDAYRLVLSVGARGLSFEGGTAHLSLPRPTDAPERAYFALLSERFLPLVKERCALLEARFPRFAGLAQEICVRPLRSVWGTCRARVGKLTFSTMLAAMPIPLIDGVVAHEYAHFIHPNHKPAFYRTLAAISPDYRALSRALTRIKREQAEESNR